jgi:parvulin-like peptidyl-prolyl isomerase
MRETVDASVDVSPAELWDAYVAEKETVTLDHVRFSPAYYRDTLSATEDEIRAWMGEHAEEVTREYEANRHRYTGLEKQVRARHILIEVAEDAADEVKAAARTRIDSALRRARAGEDFAALARELSEDPGSARRGGDLGWNPRGRMQPSFDEAMFELTAGQISDVVTTRFGYHVIRGEGVREGDVPEDDAKRELADDLYRRARASELAREAAARAIADLRSGTSMEELGRRLRPAPPTPPEPGVEPGEPPDESDDPLAPRVEQTRPFGRTGTPIPGDDGTLVRIAFELTTAAAVAEEPVEIGGDFYVVHLAERTDATRDEFTAVEQQRIREGLRRGKQAEALRVLVMELRRRAEADGAVRRNEALLSYAPEAEQTPEEGGGSGDSMRDAPREDRPTMSSAPMVGGAGEGEGEGAPAGEGDGE